MGTHPGRILPIDFRCPSRLKFLGPCAPRHRLPLALVGGKGGPIISHTSGRRLELQLGGHRRPSRGWSPKSRDALAGVLGPLDRLGVGTRVRKDGPAQRSLSPVPQERLRSWTSSRQTVPASKARCSKKGARHRGSVRVPSGIMPEWAWVVGPLSYEPVGIGRPVPPYAHRARLKGSRSSASTGALLVWGYAPGERKCSQGHPGGGGTPGGVSRAV